MQQIKISKASPKNIEEISQLMKILDIENLKFSDPERIGKNIDKGEYYIAYYENKIIGAMCLVTGLGTMFLNTLVSQKKGCGTQMIKYAIQKCKKEKIPKIYGRNMTRYKSIGFYEKMGFEEIYLLKKQWHGQDCYFIGKLI